MNYAHFFFFAGCGNSELSGDLYEDGYKNITNIDYSPVVISNMVQKYQHMPNMKWEVGDPLVQLAWQGISVVGKLMKSVNFVNAWSVNEFVNFVKS